MKKELVKKPEIKLAGISVRTNNKNETNSNTAKISAVVGRYFGENLAAKISNRKNPGVTFAAYTDYETDEHGDYTYFFGEEVTSFENVSPELKTLTIPASAYQKFTTPAGKFPAVLIEAWQQLWQMTTQDFGSNRTYQADFEVYDQRAADSNNTVIDIYIGIE